MIMKHSHASAVGPNINSDSAQLSEKDVLSVMAPTTLQKCVFQKI